MEWSVKNEMKMGMRRREVRFLVDGLLHTDDLVLCGESKEDLRAVVGWFVAVCRRRGLKVNAGKNK